MKNMFSMKAVNLLIIIGIFFSSNSFGQENYTGEFHEDQFFLKSKNKLPFNTHTGFDEEEGISIIVDYDKNASIKSIEVMKRNRLICSETLNFPNQNVKWQIITDGIWINSIDEEEKPYINYQETESIKMHYAGFLSTGEPFDNSFIRNSPLKGNLGMFIRGFAIGAINVAPNTVRIVKISPEQAYGRKGGGNIPPNATLYYIIYNMENPVRA